jgi:hypothetical protein
MYFYKIFSKCALRTFVVGRFYVLSSELSMLSMLPAEDNVSL